MAKNKPGRTRQKRAPRGVARATTNPGRPPYQFRRQPGLDKAASDYARLLVDPESAPLVHPIFAGGEGGYLFRAESTISALGTGGANNGGIFHWTPNAIGSNGLDCLSANATDAQTGNAATAIGGVGVTPGFSFLVSNASACRCIAASLKLVFIGQELSRQGRVHYGNTNGSLVNSADSVSVDALGQVLEHWERTPYDTVQLNWKPNIADTMFVDPGAATVATNKDHLSQLSVCATGLPAATGYYIRLTAVWEWKPVYATGMASASASKAQSSSTLDNVLDSLARAGYTWCGRASHSIGTNMGAGLVAGALASLSLGAARRRGALMAP